jgi:hypothetical protein
LSTVRTLGGNKIQNAEFRAMILGTYRCCRDFRSPKEVSTTPDNPLDDKSLQHNQMLVELGYGGHTSI